MNSKIARINSEIEKRTAEIISNRLSDPRLSGGLISVTAAKTTSDLKYAKVYVSMLNLADTKEALKVINNAAGFIRNELKSAMDIRNMPELTFYLDTSIEYGMKIDKLLKDIKEKDEKNNG